MSSHLARGAAERAALTAVFRLGLSNPFCLGPGGRLDMAGPVVGSVRLGGSYRQADHGGGRGGAARSHRHQPR